MMTPEEATSLRDALEARGPIRVVESLAAQDAVLVVVRRL